MNCKENRERKVKILIRSKVSQVEREKSIDTKRRNQRGENESTASNETSSDDGNVTAPRHPTWRL